ncbi:hypothetical protein [Halococcus thailandensis]|uniref:hypothetical protein n=1 Tax=Halococcus thailandensis TaxID=335952 RepID=UPI00126801C0|nr:hypothetical protein [Halococcus thailandensis]
MSNSNDTTSGRSSISVSTETKQRFNTLRRLYSAHANEDMTGDDTLDLLLDSFDEHHEWSDTGDTDS